MTLKPVCRWLRGYDATEELKVEYPLPDSWTLVRLQDFCGVSNDEPLF